MMWVILSCRGQFLDVAIDGIMHGVLPEIFREFGNVGEVDLAVGGASASRCLSLR